MTATTAERLTQAKVSYGDRKVTYTWANPVMDKTYHEPNDSGEQVELSLRHDPKRKQYTATISVSWWQPTTATGFKVTIYSPFDPKFPASQFHKVPVARYSDKSFEQFQNDTLAILASIDLDGDSVVADLLNRVLSY